MLFLLATCLHRIDHVKHSILHAYFQHEYNFISTLSRDQLHVESDLYTYYHDSHQHKSVSQLPYLRQGCNLDVVNFYPNYKAVKWLMMNATTGPPPPFQIALHVIVACWAEINGCGWSVYLIIGSNLEWLQQLGSHISNVYTCRIWTIMQRLRSTMDFNEWGVTMQWLHCFTIILFRTFQLLCWSIIVCIHNVRWSRALWFKVTLSHVSVSLALQSLVWTHFSRLLPSGVSQPRNIMMRLRERRVSPVMFNVHTKTLSLPKIIFPHLILLPWLQTTSCKQIHHISFNIFKNFKGKWQFNSGSKDGMAVSISKSFRIGWLTSL